MLRQRARDDMKAANATQKPQRAPMRALPHVLLALAAALAFLLSGGVDPAGAQTPTPRILVSNFDQTQDGGVVLHESTGVIGTDATLAQEFMTGFDVGGYSLTAIDLRLRVPSGKSLPEVTLRSGSPTGTVLTTLTGSVTASNNIQDITFAPSSAYTLTAGTSYWVVAEGGEGTIYGTAADDEDADSAPGWSIANDGRHRSAGSVIFNTANSLKIQVKGTIIPVQGDPTISGRFAVGETLTADTSTITDFDGLTSPTYTYQWARVGASASATDISGATGSSYTVVTADSGHRLRLTVSFSDDASNAETRTVATSYIPPIQDRTLVGTTLVPVAQTGLQRGLAVSFTPGGTVGTRYRVKDVVWNFTSNSNTSADTLNFSLYTADSNGHPVQSVARLNNPEREDFSGSFTFTAPAGESIVVEAGTRYALVAYDGAEDALGCGAGSSLSQDSLPGWTIGDRTHFLTTSETAVSSVFYDRPCIFRIRGQHIPPRITDMEVTSRPNRHTGRYVTGTNITVSATMNEAVTFDGPRPVLGITIGDNVRDAAYSPPDSTATELVFKYTIQSSDEDRDGKITIDENALRGYAAADFSHNELEQEGTVNPRAVVESVRVSSTPLAPEWYGPEETIQFTARFTIPVRVEGDPQFGFNVNEPAPDPENLADFVRVSEDGRDVIFEYEIGTTENDLDGIWLWDQTKSFRLDGDDAIVAVYNGRDAVLDHSELGNQAGHKVTQNPRVVSIEVTSDPAHGTNSDTYGQGNEIEFTVTFNQPVTVTGDPEFEFSTAAPPDKRAAYVRGSGTTRLVFSYTVLAADMDPNGIWIGDETRTFKLDTDSGAEDHIRGTGNSLNANFEHDGLETQGGHKVDGSIIPAANSVATGAPTITAPDVLTVPATLRVDLSGITDANGTSNIANNATYNWQRFSADGTTLEDDDIGTGPTYDLTHYDGNRKIKVQVYFTDDEGHSEGPLTSAATDEISVALVSNIGAGRSPQGGPTLSDGSAGQSPSAAAQAFTTGPSPDWYTLTRIEMELLYNFSDDLPQVTLHRGSPTGDPIATFTAPASTSPDNDYQFVEFTPSSSVLLASNADYWVVLAGGGSVVVWAQSTDDDDGAADGWSLADDSQLRAVDGTEFSDGRAPLRVRVYGYTGGRPANQPHTGTPTIAAANNVFRVPAELYVDFSTITDGNGTENIYDNATYTWKRYAADGTTFESNIGTGAVYTLTADDVGKTIKVDVTFEDDDEYTETPDTIAATAVITAAATCAAPTLTGGAQFIVNRTAQLYWFAVHNSTDQAVFDSQHHEAYYPRSRFLVGDRVFDITQTPLMGTDYLLSEAGHNRLQPSGVPTSETFFVALSGLGTAPSQSLLKQLTFYSCDQPLYFPEATLRSSAILHEYTWTNPSIDWSTHAQRTIYITRDQAAPTIESATANGASLVVTFSEDLDEDATLPTSAFTVKKTASGTETTQNPTAVSISGKTVTLTLGTAVTATDTAVKVTYTKPTSGSDNKLADDFGNEADTFTDQLVTNALSVNIPHTGAPTIAAANNVFRVPAELYVDFSTITDGNGTENIYDNATYTWKRYAADGTTEEDANIGTGAVYTLTAADAGKTIKVDVTFEDDGGYTETPDTSPATAVITAAATCAAPALEGGAQRIMIYMGNLNRSASLTDRTSHDLYAPPLDPVTLALIFPNETLTIDNPYSFIRANHNRDLVDPELSTLEISLTGTPALTNAQLRQLALYVCDAPLLFSDATASMSQVVMSTTNYVWTNPSIDWSTHAQRTVYITRDQVAPTIESATANGASLVITFNEDLDEDATLANSAFTVKKTASGTETMQNPTAVSISGKTLTLTLGTAVTATDTAVKVTYTKPTSGSDNKLADDFGNEVANFTDQEVVNQLADDDPPGISTTTPPTLVAAGKTLTITYDENLKSTGSTPAETAFQVMATPAGGSATSFTPTAVSISGAEVSLTFDKPFAHNDALTVTYTKPGTNPIQDAAGNDAPEFTTPLDVTNDSTIPRISITAVRTEATPGLANAEFRVTRSNTSSTPLDVQITFTQDDDYLSSTSGSITIDANATQATKTFPSTYSGNTTGDLKATVAGDSDHLPALTPNHEATVRMKLPPAGSILTLQVDDVEVEEGETALVSVRVVTGANVVQPRIGGTLAVITRSGSAVLIQDYTHVSRNISFPVADWTRNADMRYEVSATVTIVTIETEDALGNEVHEADETFFLDVSPVSGQPPVFRLNGSFEITINDDDALALEDVTVSGTPTNGSYYDLNETITFHLEFNGNVTVTGTPTFSFLLGSNTRQAEYASGRNTDTLVFTYDVTSTDNDHDGISWPAGTVALNGGTIKLLHTDPTEQDDAVRTYDAQAALTAQKVDSAKPALESQILFGDTLTLTYSEDLNTTAPATGAFTVTVNGSANAVTAVSISGKTVDLTLTTEVTDEDATVTVTYVKPSTNPIQDLVGREADAFSNQTVTVSTDMCVEGHIWCGTMSLQVSRELSGGRSDLVTDELDTSEFVHNDVTYGVRGILLKPNPAAISGAKPPFHIPERGTLDFVMWNLSATDTEGQWTMPNSDYLDWTLHVSTQKDGTTLAAALPFSDAKFCCGTHWTWYGGDLDEMNSAWETGKLYTLSIVRDPRADRQPQPPGPPLYLQVSGVNRTSAVLSWTKPQTRNDAAPPGVSYKLQWKLDSGRWDTASDVSTVTMTPSRTGMEWLVETIRGRLLPAKAYHVRVLATNTAGDSEPSKEVLFTTDAAASGQQAGNTPAGGFAGITGSGFVGDTLTATTSDITDVDGMTNAVFTYQWKRGEPGGDDEDAVNIPGATGRSYTPTSDDEIKLVWVVVSFTDDRGALESVPSAARMLISPPLGDPAPDPPNSRATGEPGIDGVPHIGETLTATTTEIADADGMTNAVFTYQWIRHDPANSTDTNIEGATGQTYVLTSLDRDKTIRVLVTFSDDADHEESLTSPATETVTRAPLTADLLDHPETHDGETPFTFELRFSEEPAKGLSFRTIRDYLFDVTGGAIDHVSRLDRGSGKRWRVTVDPAGDADVVVVQKPTISNCESWRAVCTPDGAKLSGSESFTVKGPASQEPANSLATGEPEIDGTLRVGSTLTATTSNIADADGMTGAVFTYQWQRIDTGNNNTEGEDITGATAQTYVVTSGDVDRALRVVVSFTDDADNAESVPSPATETVTDAPPAHTDRPYNLRAVVQDGAVVLTWEEPDITRNHADDYRIYRHRPELGEPETLVYVDFTADITDTYTDTGVAPGVLYVYRVQAVIDFFGNLGEISDPVEIRTPGQPQEQQSEEQTDEQQTDEQVYDFDAGEGQRVLAGARIRAGDRGRKSNEDHDRAWYATDTTDWHASGELLDGALAWNGMTVNRVVYFPDTDVFRLNDPRDDFDLGASFQEGGVNRELTIWVQTATDKVSFLAKDHIVNSGGHWINFEVPDAIRTVLDGIATGDEITIAVSVPE